MSRIRIAGVGVALVLSALIGGTIIGSVAAGTLPSAGGGAPAAAVASPGQDPSGSAAGSAAASAAGAGPDSAATGQAPGKYCESFRKAFAAALGVDESKLGPAATTATASTIDAALAAGDLSQAQADRLQALLKAAQLGGCPRFIGRIGQARPVAGVIRDGVQAAATALGLTPAALHAQLQAGKSLKDIATALGVPYATVTAAAVSAVKVKLDAAIAAGTIRQAREDRILARLEANLAAGRLRNPAPGASGTPGG